MPRFLLQRFAENPAEDGSLVHQLELESGQCRRVNPRNAAVVRDFYALVDEEGNRHQDAEHALGQIEGLAAPLIERLEEPGARLEGEDRYNLAIFIAMLWLRTPLWRERFRHTEEQLAEFIARHAPPDHYLAAARAAGEEITLAEAAAQRDEVIAALDCGGIEIDAPPERHVTVLFEHGKSTAWIIFRLDWTLIRAAASTFVIADEPVTVYEVEDGRARGSSAPLGSPAAEMVVPLGSRLALVLRPGADLLADAARDQGRELREITDVQIIEQLGRPVVWGEEEATGEQISDINLRSYAHAQSSLYGQSQGMLTDLRHDCRGALRERVTQLRPHDPSFTIFHQMPGEPERVWQMPHRPQRPARPRR